MIASSVVETLGALEAPSLAMLQACFQLDTDYLQIPGISHHLTLLGQFVGNLEEIAVVVAASAALQVVAVYTNVEDWAAVAVLVEVGQPAVGAAQLAAAG